MANERPLVSYLTEIFSSDVLAGLGTSYLDFPVSLSLVEDIGAFVAECESETREFKAAGSERLNDWELGWAGHGVVGVVDGAPEEDLPFYFKKNTHLRLMDKVYRDNAGYAEFAALRVLQAKVFSQHRSLIDNAEAVIEYGCGTGHNLRYLKSEVDVVQHWGGCDWAQSAVDRIRSQGIVAKEFSSRVDYFRPETFWAPKVSFIAFTNASLEQSGSRYTGFVDYLVDHPLCIGAIHIEPIRELLSGSQLDRNSFEYAERRGYLTGFIDYLSAKDITFRCKHNFGIGSKYISGYQVVVWQK
jgi:hypothetical protein